MLVKQILDRDAERDIRDQARAIKKFRVVGDSAADDELDVFEQPAIPNIGAPYDLPLSTRGALVCVRQRIERLAPLLWEVVCQYDTQLPSEFLGETTRPLLQPPRISWSGSHYLEYKREDVNGKEFVDAAGTPMENLPPQEQPLLICHYERNELFFNAYLFLDYVKTVNAGVFGAFSAGFCKLENITGTPEYWQGQSFCKVVYEIHIRRDPWNPTRILNQGPFALENIYTAGTTFTTKRVPVKDEFGNRAGRPMPLKADGYQLPRIDPTTEERSSLVFLDFELLREADWGPLGL